MSDTSLHNWKHVQTHLHRAIREMIVTYDYCESSENLQGRIKRLALDSLVHRARDLRERCSKTVTTWERLSDDGARPVSTEVCEMTPKDWALYSELLEISKASKLR